MKRLYLLRHAKSSQTADFSGDHERQLAPRGVAATERLSRYLEAHAARPDLVLCSSARRTRETFEGIAGGLSGELDVAIDSDLYCASTGYLLERIRQLSADVEVAMLIGHNPGLHGLAMLLAGQEGQARLSDFPTGALVTLDVVRAEWDDLGEGACTIADYVVPRELS